MKSITSMGFWIAADREFPSLIKGGQANFDIFFADERIYGQSTQIDM